MLRLSSCLQAPAIPTERATYLLQQRRRNDARKINILERVVEIWVSGDDHTLAHATALWRRTALRRKRP